MFNIFRNKTIFQNDCIPLHPYQQYMKVLICLHSFKDQLQSVLICVVLEVLVSHGVCDFPCLLTINNMSNFFICLFAICTSQKTCSYCLPVFYLSLVLLFLLTLKQSHSHTYWKYYMIAGYYNILGGTLWNIEVFILSHSLVADYRSSLLPVFLKIQLPSLIHISIADLLGWCLFTFCPNSKQTT